MNSNTNIKQGYKQTSLGILPQEWEVVRFNDIFIRIPSKKYQIKTKEYQSNGKYPVIDQGQTAVISYSNNDNEVFKNSSVIVFGDHTRELKFVDFDFVVGADGVQLLKTKENFDNRFFYYQLKTKKIPNTGYNRHFKFLLDMSFVCPTLAEQEKIAQILGVWDKGISVLKSLIEAKTKRKKALMQRLLTPPCESPTPSLRASETSAAIYKKSVDCHDLTASNLAMTEKNSKAKQSLRFAEFTDKWQEMRLGDICEIYQPQTIPQSDFTKEGYNVYGANGIIGKYHSYNHEKEQIAIACRGNSCGAVNFTNPKSWITGNAMVINLDNSKNADKIFVYYVLLNSNLNYLVTGSGQPQITSNIKKHSIKLPTLAEQKKIAQVLSACDKEIELLKSKFQCLKTQKRGLMQRLLNGEVRVKC